MAKGWRTSEVSPKRGPDQQLLLSTRHEEDLSKSDLMENGEPSEKSFEPSSNSGSDQSGVPETNREKAESIPTNGGKRLGRLRRPRDVAGRLNISERQVRNLAAKGGLVSVRFGKLYLFRDEDIEDFIQQHRIRGGAK